MAGSILKASVTFVSIGSISIEGFMGDDGSFYIAVPQMVQSGFFALPKNANRDLKRLMGEDFPLFRLKTELNSNPVNAVSLLDFERVLAKLDRAGNIKAQEFRDLMVGLSLKQLFSDAFGIKFEAQDRQEELKRRQERLLARHAWTDVVKRHLESQGCYLPSSPETVSVFKSLTVKVNLTLFNQPHFNGNRDNMTPEQQRLITSFETILAERSRIHPQDDPYILVDRVLASFK